MARATDKVPDWLLERLSAGELAHAQATELRQRLRAQGEEYRLSALSASDAEILSGVRFAAERMKQVLEPAGAAALAAVLHGRVPIRAGERVAVVFSGGNVALDRLGSLLEAAATIPGL